MHLTNKMLRGFLAGEDGFRNAVRQVIRSDLKMTIKEFCTVSGIPKSTMYKLISGLQREPNLRTVRAIFRGVRCFEERKQKGFIGIIAARPVIEKIVERKILVDGKPAILREYSASTVEDAIVAAVNAEKDGASAIVCAPIIGTTVEKIVGIPVIPIIPEQSVVKAIKLAAKRSMMG